MKIIIPPLTNQLVNLIKNTSVLAMIAGGDLMYRTDSWSSSNMYYGPAYVVSGLLYFIICYPLARFARKLELKEKKQKTTVSETSIERLSVATEGGL
jgi:putative glutamine transport system permease protein